MYNCLCIANVIATSAVSGTSYVQSNFPLGYLVGDKIGGPQLPNYDLLNEDSLPPIEDKANKGVRAYRAPSSLYWTIYQSQSRS